MKLVENWGAVLARAWSMKTAYVIFLFGVVQAALPFFGDVVSPVLLGSITIALAAVLGVVRIVDQQDAALADQIAGATVTALAQPAAKQPASPDEAK